MKGFLLFFAVFFGLCAPAYASKPSKIYIGGDFLSNESKHQYFSESNVNGSASAYDPFRKDSSAQAFGGGLFAGFKSYSRRYFVAPEIFFDYVNNTAEDFFTGTGGVAIFDTVDGVQAGTRFTNEYNSDVVKIDYRYGFKMNFGYRPTTRLDIFANAGLGWVRYYVGFDGPTCEVCHTAYTSTEMAPIYGAGVSYNLNDSLVMRGSYDFQRIRATYVFQGLVDQVDLSTFRLGFYYQFNVFD